MVELPQNYTGTPTQTSQSANRNAGSANLNYKSINYSTWKYTKTSAGLLHLCDLRN